MGDETNAGPGRTDRFGLPLGWVAYGESDEQHIQRMEVVRAFIHDAHRAVQRQLEPAEAEAAWKEPLRRRRGPAKGSQRNPEQDVQLLRRYLDVAPTLNEKTVSSLAKELAGDFRIEVKSLETHIRRLVKRWNAEYAEALASTNALRPFMILSKQTAD